MSKMKEKFLEVMAQINDAYVSHLIDGDAKDRITNAMTMTYIDEARAVAIKNGDMAQDDDDDSAFAELDELFDATQTQEQFVNDLEVAYAYAANVHFASEISELIKSARDA